MFIAEPLFPADGVKKKKKHRALIFCRFKTAAMVLEFCPLPPAAVPGLTSAFSQSVGAVVSCAVLEKTEVTALIAADHRLQAVSGGIIFSGHGFLQKSFGAFFCLASVLPDSWGIEAPVSP